MNLFTFIKNHLSIINVISEYATLKKAGLYWKGVCPFHHEKTASFTVSPHKEIFYCFGCHVGGDVIAFIAQVEQCSPLQAVYYLAERYNLELPEDLKNSTKEDFNGQMNHRKRYWTLCNYVAQWCHKQLLKNPTILSYLKQRNINDEIIKKFQLGYFPLGLDAIQDLIKYAQQHTILSQDLLEANIIVEGKKVLYSPLADRIMFPIKDHLGRLCGFGGRVYTPQDERPKYYNCKENSYFSKGSLLFGFDLAKKQIQETGHVFLVEGYIDCLAMVQHGFINTVATLGTACTIEQLKILARYAQELYVTYDGDEAGKKAMLRLTELCWQVNLDLRIVQLPPKEDPDSFLKKGGNVQQLIDQAQDIFVFFIENLGKGFLHKNLNEKMSTIRSLLEVVVKVDDPLKKDILLQRAAAAFDVPLASLTKELSKNAFLKQNYEQNKQIHEKTGENSASSPISNKILQEMTILEKKLFSVIIININVVKKEDEEYLLEYLSPPLRDLLKKLTMIKEAGKPVNFIDFFDELQENEKLLISHLILECQEYEGLRKY